MNRQGEKDVPIHSSRTDFTGNTYMTAQEHCNNQVVFIVRCYVKDVKIFLKKVFSKYNSTRTDINAPSIEGYADAVESLFYYEEWIMKNTPVGGILPATTRGK